MIRTQEDVDLLDRHTIDINDLTVQLAVQRFVLAITEGKIDSYLTILSEAISSRHSVIKMIRTANVAIELKVGDHIKLVRVRPQYLIGATGLVNAISGQKVSITLDERHRKLSRSLNVPISCIEVI